MKMINLLRKSKNGQEEMTGFAMIIIIVSIIGLVLLAFMLRKPSTSQYNSFEVQQFLDTAMKIRSSCTLAFDNAPLRMADLIQQCYSNSADSCNSGQKVCKSLQISMNDIINSSWQINPQAPYTGYKMEISLEYPSNSSKAPAKILNATGGSCKNNFYGGQAILPEKSGDSNFVTRLQLCLSNSSS